jgi:hypothetical protein
MSAMSVEEGTAGGSLSGATASSLLIPIGLAVIFGILGLVYALMAAPTEEDRAAAAYLAGRLERDNDDDLYEPAPPQSGPNGRRMPTGGASWTFRDRAGQ